MDKFRFLSNPVESILQCQHTVITSPLSISKRVADIFIIPKTMQNSWQ